MLIGLELETGSLYSSGQMDSPQGRDTTVPSASGGHDKKLVPQGQSVTCSLGQLALFLQRQTFGSRNNSVKDWTLMF